MDSTDLATGTIAHAAAAGPVAAARAVAALAFERAPLLDEDGAFPEREVELLHQMGLLAAPLPVGRGGTGLGIGPEGAGTLLEVLRAIGAGSLPLGRLYEGHVNALALVRRYAGGAAAPLTAEAAAGTLFGVWNSDDASGLFLEWGGDGLRLRGRKILCSGAGHVTRPLVTARTTDGVVMVVPRLTRGVGADLSAWRPHGMRASATGAVDLTGVQVAASEVIGSPGDYLREPAFSAGAWRFAAVQLGGVEALVDQLRRHLRQLGRHGDPHQMARTGSAALAAETARLWLARAAVLAEDERTAPERAVAYVGLARTAVERAALEVLELTHRSVGLQGFMRAHPIERLTRDLATYLRQPAPDRALAVAAAYVLGDDTPVASLW